MKIMVLIKKTPDTEAKIDISGAAINTKDIKYIINPYDEFAIEEALKIREQKGSGEVIIASFSSSDTRELIIKGLAMGADRGLLIDNAGLEDADSLTIAKILRAVIAAEKPELVICGKQAIDDDNMHVPLMTAELLGWPHCNVVTKLAVEGQSLQAEREVEGGQVEVYKLVLPAIIGAHKSLNTPRYASLPGIMKAKKKPLDTKTVADFGLTSDSLKSGNKVKVTGYRRPAEKPQGKILKGQELGQMVKTVVQLLRDEAKVI